MATFHNGFTVIFLGKTGNRFFVYSQHCNDEMKIQIKVLPPKIPHSLRRRCQHQHPPATPPPCGRCHCAKQRTALIIVSSILLILLLIIIFSASIVGFRIYKTDSTTITTNQATASPIASTATTSPAIDHPQSRLLAIKYPDTQSSLSRLHAPEEALAMAGREV